MGGRPGQFGCRSARSITDAGHTIRPRPAASLGRAARDAVQPYPLTTAVEQPLDGEEAVGEVRLRRRTGAHTCARVAEEVELAPVGLRGVHDGRARTEAAAVGEELDRAHAVLLLAFLDLARLLVRVHVQRQRLLRGVSAELDEPIARARPDRVGGHPDAHAGIAELLELAQVVGDRRLPEALDPAARIRDV